jgi:hypothetical protein
VSLIQRVSLFHSFFFVFFFLCGGEGEVLWSILDSYHVGNIGPATILHGNIYYSVSPSHVCKFESVVFGLKSSLDLEPKFCYNLASLVLFLSPMFIIGDHLLGVLLVVSYRYM